MDELLFMKEFTTGPRSGKEQPRAIPKLNPRDVLRSLYKEGQCTDDDFRKVNIYPLSNRAAVRYSSHLVVCSPQS